MKNNTDFVLPVVIVGKDRTRMTCAVIDHIKEHIKNANPYFICVSDRSRAGHDTAIEHHLNAICEKEYQVLRTLPEENRYGWGAAINIGLECAFDVCKDSSFALVVDNDWLLQRDLDIDKYAYSFKYSDIGGITFKPVHAGTNVKLEDITLSDGSTYCIRHANLGGDRFSFTAEIGCMLITKRMVQEAGRFKENCVTDETEWAFCNWYNGMPDEEKSDKHLWFATDKDMLYTELNGEGHVFTHVGLNSQHEGPHKWDCPNEYRYLSDRAIDEYLIQGTSVDNSVERIPCVIVGRDRTESTKGVIDCLACHLQGINPIFIYVSDRSQVPQCEEMKAFFKERGYVGEVLETTEERWGLGAAMNIGVEKSFELSSSGKCLLFENDIFLMRDLDISGILESLQKGECGAFVFKWPNGAWLEGVDIKKIETHSLSYCICDAKNPDKENYAYAIGAQIITKRFFEVCGHFKECVPPPSVELDACYKYSIIPREEKKKNGLFVGRSENITLGEHEYNNEFFAHGHQATQKFLDIMRIDNPWDGKIPSSQKADERIDWSRYVDRIYVFHYLPHSNRLDRLHHELKRVGILDSGILEMRYTIPTRYNRVLMNEVCAQDRWSRNDWVASLGMEQMRAFQEALYFGYKRVMILENDIAFLKDKDALKTILDNLPTGYDYIQLDKFITPGFGRYQEYTEENKINDFFFTPTTLHTGADCVIMNDEAMRQFCSVFENHITPSDIVIEKMSVRQACAIKNACIQINYANSGNLQLGTIEYQDACYREQQISYSDYEVPEGYGYGSIVSEKKSDTKFKKGVMRDSDSSINGLARLIYSVSDHPIKVLEVGSYAGESAELFMRSGKVASITCIDPWQDRQDANPHNRYQGMSAVEAEFDSRMAPFGNKVQKYKGTLAEYIEETPGGARDFDLVYIDALHDYENCKEDIINVLNHIRPKIAIAGHDYNPSLPGVAGVKEAVDEIFNGDIKVFEDTSWLHLVNKEVSEGIVSTPIKKGRKFISVYAIAKNEASVAERWYNCVKEADEVCVLDTGSTDDTVNLLRSLGAKVTVKTYEDWSFAVARNDSMKLVSPEAEILFTLDLDETIAPGWRKKLEDAWCAKEQEGFSPSGCLYKYIWSFYPDGKTPAAFFSVRKIHASGTGKWYYRCHELLREVDESKVFFLDDFVVEHHQNKKTNRNTYLPLLEKDVQDMPNDDRSVYYYARELMYSGQHEKAIKYFKKHLTLPSAGWRAERAASMRNIADCYHNLKNDDLCELWLRKSADEDPTNREATFRLGQMYMERKDYREAVKMLARCTSIEKPSLEYISAPIVWSGLPWMLYSQALWWTGDWDSAVSACEKAAQIEPANTEIISQLRGMTATRDAHKKN